MPLLILDVVTEQQLGAWIAFAALLFLVGCTLSYYLSRRVALREVERMRKDMEQAVAQVAAKVAEQKPAATPVAAQPAPAPVPQPVPAPAAKAEPKPAPPAAPPKEEGLSEEILLVIAAAVAAHLGKTVRIRHARLVQPPMSSPWAQQGRVIVQASHALAVSHRG